MNFSMMAQITVASVQAHFDKPWGNYLLEKIVETQTPEFISWFPQTIGWKILAVFILFFISYKGYKIYKIYKIYQSNAYRREALSWLAHCQKTDDINLYKQLPALLRKTALSAFKRSEVSQLTGSCWEHWLDQQCQKTSFVSSCPTLLHQLAFKPINANTLTKKQNQILITQVTLWVKYHRRLDD
ncbi:DUF4381 domain-containing protein [Candidatus Colwellia aromaticivorans]|uniref:DUF4381 domain-containing protein n=1 Tax=Candidatus Colwellia aromaticivorans TaxID=2267621 RepID=UPI000DF2ED5E|nr:DUF4381 domain-containing protein [Candidatus Colwellia aromaticivorans]